MLGENQVLQDVATLPVDEFRRSLKLAKRGMTLTQVTATAPPHVVVGLGRRCPLDSRVIPELHARARLAEEATRRSCIISYPGLLTILVSPNGSVATESLEPKLQIAGGATSFGDRGDGVGVMRVGRGGQSA